MSNIKGFSNMQPNNISTDAKLNDSDINLGVDGDIPDTKTLADLPNDSAELIRSEMGVSGEALNKDGEVEGEKLGEEGGHDEMEVENKGLEVMGTRDLVEGSERGSVNEEGVVGESDMEAVLGNFKSDDVGGVEVGKGVDGGELGVEVVGVDEKVKSVGTDSSVPDMEKAKDGNSAGEATDVSDFVAIKAVSSGAGVAVCMNESENIGVNVSECSLSGSNGEHEIKGQRGQIGDGASYDEKAGGDICEGSMSDQEKEVGNGTEVGGSNRDSGEAFVSKRRLSGPKGSRGGKRKLKGGFCASDLVWGKVRSHPWWPAQVFEPEDASDQAKKHFRSNSYLVAYFGDKSFAWNDEAKLKPFMPHFCQMTKQSNMEAFRHAVDCALDEIGRRVEFGLSCRCIPDDAYSRLKTQVFENAGIREKSSIHEGQDRHFNASTFEPLKLIENVKNLAQVLRVEEVERLEHVKTQAQVSAFYRWKGYDHLPEFGQLMGYVNNEADAPIRSEKKEIQKIVSDEAVAPEESQEEGRTRPQKRKKLTSDSGILTKKPKTLSDLMGKKRTRSEPDDGEASDQKTGRKSILSSAGRRKDAKVSCSESRTEESSPQSNPSRVLKSSFRVGESILRVAGQLSQPSPLLKLDLSSKKTTKSEGKSKQPRKEAETIPTESTSSDVILSQLLLTAVEPPKEHSLLSPMITFVSDFRNSVAQDTGIVLKHEEPPGDDIIGKSEDNTSGSEPKDVAVGCASGGKLSAEKAPVPKSTRTSSFDSVQDACCTDKLIEVPERQTLMGDEKMVSADTEVVEANGEQAAVKKIDETVSDSYQHSVSDNVASERGPSDEDIQVEESPTALTLKFTDMDSIPTEAKLHKIFSTFGPLKESETEVLAKKKCARVVFKKRVDAETAFSSSGKFETFGASLVCYRLNYAPSPRKSSPLDTK